MEEAEEVQREAEGADLWDLAELRRAKENSLGPVEQREENYDFEFSKLVQNH